MSQHFPLEFGLQNFKAFGSDMQKIDLKPINLVYGKNSSGKSSLLHSLLFLHEMSNGGAGSDIHRTTLGEDFVDLGGFKNYAHGKEVNGTVTFSFAFSTEDPDFPEWEVQLSLQDIRIQNSGADKAVMMLRKRYLTEDEEAFSYILDSAGDGTYRLEFNEKSEWYSRMEGQVRESSTGADSFSGVRFKVDRVNPFLLGRIIGPVDNISFLPDEPDKLFSGFMDRLIYLAGLRTVPEKSFFDGGAPSRDNRNAGGMVYWEKIRADEATRRQVNNWLRLLFNENESDDEPARYRIDVNPFVSPLAASREAYSFFDLLKESGDFSPKDQQAAFMTKLRELPSKMNVVRILQDEKLELTARELGVGVSQVIPLLGAACQKNRCVMIEQPEIHLHPKQQADLGEIFAKSALDESFGTRNTFLIETHSIHILERLGKMIRDGESHSSGISVKPEDIAIYFVDPHAEDEEYTGGARISCLELLEDGRLESQFPGNFFNEDMNDLF